MGLFDIKKRHEALQAKWIQTISEHNTHLHSHAAHFLGLTKEELDVVLGSNLSPKDCIALFPEDTFWRWVLVNWCRICYHEPQNQVMVLKQNLWYNTLIRKKNLPMVNKRAITNGLIKVEDIYNTESNCFYTLDYLHQHYNKAITWLEYEQIK